MSLATRCDEIVELIDRVFSDAPAASHTEVHAPVRPAPPDATVPVPHLSA